MIQTTNFSHGTSDLSSIKEFRRRTKRQGKVILDNFADNGVLIVRLKKLERKRQLSNSEKQELQKLQQKSRNIIDQINKILSGSKYTASDVLLNGYPELTKGERRYWLGIEETRSEKQEVKKSKTKSVTKSSSSSGSLDFNIDDEFLDDLEAEINKTQQTISRAQNKLEKQIEPSVSSEQQATSANKSKIDDTATLPDHWDLNKDIVVKEFKPLVDELWKNGGGSIWGFIKECAKLASGAFGLIYSAQFLQYIVEDCNYIAGAFTAETKAAEIAAKCSESAKSLISPVHKFLRKFITPFFTKLSLTHATARQVISVSGKVLSKLFFWLFIFQLIWHWGEMFIKTLAKSAYSTSKEYLDSLLSQLKICTSALGNKQNFRYLNFNVKDIGFSSVGLQYFMRNTDYAPIARYYSRDNPDKEEGLLYISVYDPNLYVSEVGQKVALAATPGVNAVVGLKAATGRSIVWDSTTYTRYLDEYREQLLNSGIPQKKLGEDQYKLIQLHLVPYDDSITSVAMGEKTNRSLVLLEAVNPNANQFLYLFKYLSETGKLPTEPIGDATSFIRIPENAEVEHLTYLNYLFTVDPFEWTRSPELRKTSWMKSLYTVVDNAASLVVVRLLDFVVRVIKYFFQNEKDDDFVVTGTFDPVTLIMETIDSDTNIPRSWVPWLKNIAGMNIPESKERSITNEQ